MMSPQQALLGLPTSLLMLVATQLHAQQIPTAVKKMSLDEGEKILPHYLGFASELEPPVRSPIAARRILDPEEELLLAANSSATLPFRPPFGVHHSGDETWEDPGPAWALFRRRRDALARLQGRQFACPENTKSCDSIGQPNYCCATGETCFKVENAPTAGNVGCCPVGLNCGGTVGVCGAGSTACSADMGGGCCIRGYMCAQIGCVASSVSVITMTTTSSTVISLPSPTTAVTTVVVTVSPSSPPPATSTVTQTTTNSGGLPPYRPTSGTGTPVTTDEPTQTTEPPGDYCPTGFYACLATAGSGCCRTGRDCVTTSCPPIEKTTLTSNGVTLVLPASDVPSAQPTSTCANGWFLCPSEAGPVAGCCPSGYDCGTASCTLSAPTATATVQKERPSSGTSWKSRGGYGAVWSMLWSACGILAGTVML